MPTIVLQFFHATLGLFGDERAFPQGRGDTTFVLADTVSWINGRHSWKFGSEWRDFRNNNFNSDPGQLVYNSPANFINDTPDSAARTVGNVANRLNQAALDFFAQDSFKFRPYLTLELGLRYAWNMSPSEAKDRFCDLRSCNRFLDPCHRAIRAEQQELPAKGWFLMGYVSHWKHVFSVAAMHTRSTSRSPVL